MVPLPLNQPVTVEVQAVPTSVGVKSAILEVDAPATVGVDKQIQTTVIVSTPAEYTYSVSGSVQRSSTRAYFVTVPEGATSLQIPRTQTGDNDSAFSGVDPYGVPQTLNDDTNPAPDVIEYAHPTPGVWEIVTRGSYNAKLLDNSYAVRRPPPEQRSPTDRAPPATTPSPPPRPRPRTRRSAAAHCRRAPPIPSSAASSRTVPAVGSRRR